MKIQYLGYNIAKSDKLTISSFESPKGLDSFDINVIDLNHIYVWRNDENDSYCINKSKDYILLTQMINNSIKSKIIYIFPQDYCFKYNVHNKTNDEYYRKKELRKVLNQEFKYILENTFSIKDFIFEYENNETILCTNCYSSAFYFNKNCIFNFEILNNAEYTGKITTITNGIKFYTTLNIKSEEELFDFLEHNKLLKEKSEVPEWLKQIKFYNDETIMHKMEENNKKINDIALDNENNQKILEKNLYYKKMLIATGDELVNIVFDVLQEILEIDLASFVDKKKEDFKFEYNNITFIGEIKGVNSNVNNKMISQTDDHLSDFLDDIENEKDYPECRKILIVNHQKNKPLEERLDIHNNQISKANRDDVLIIETKTLLLILDKFRKKELVKEDFFNMLREKKGILSI